MSDPPGPSPVEVPFAFPSPAERLVLAGQETGAGRPAVLLHGLTATRRYVVHGARSLERGGLRVVAYDARGHGGSSPAEARDLYGYEQLADDLERVLEQLEIDRPVLVGNSMGAHTAVCAALRDPGRVAGLVLITPAYAGRPLDDDDLADWDRLATGLRDAGIEGFLAAYDPPVEGEYRETVMAFTRQRLERHDDLDAVADALAVVPRSRPFGDLDALGALEGIPTLVVGSLDGADPGHPREVAEAYAEHIPGAELLVEDEGESPIAWRGVQLSRAILDLVERRVS
jgi:pimeloyl-ACP methyl ester carboxylesterase